MFARLPFAVLITLLAASPGAFAWNLLKNPDFSGSTNSWNLSQTGGGGASYESVAGSPAGGSLRLQAYAGQTAHADQCVDVSRWLNIDFGLRQFDNAEFDGTHTFKLDIYDTAACTGAKLSTITLPVAGGTGFDCSPTCWYEVSVLGTPLPSGAVSAKVNLDTNGGAAGVSYYLIDHVQVVPPDAIFPDAFEGN